MEKISNGGSLRERRDTGRFAADPHPRHAPTSLSPAERLLERLESVKQTRPDRWQARCPSHDDRSPSLIISELSDQTILLRCWAGCSALEVVSAVGLELKDLFPPRLDGTYRKGASPRYSASEVLRTAMLESNILEIGYRTLQREESLSLSDQARVEVALMTLQNIRGAIR